MEMMHIGSEAMTLAGVTVRRAYFQGAGYKRRGGTERNEESVIAD